MKYLRTAKIKNKTVLLRLDLNVPIANGRVMDDFRIQTALPAIWMLQEGGNRVVIVSHLGRPEGRDPKLSLKPVAQHLAGLLGYKFIATHHPLPSYPVNHLIFYTGNIESDLHTGQLSSLSPKDIVFLENIRYYKGEEENDSHLAKKLAELADIYVNDAFSVCHRKAASVVAVTKLLPSYCGLALEQEIKSLTQLLTKSKSPFVVLMGGIKISDKVKAIENLGKKADRILIGGGLASLFFKARGLEVGTSKIEDEAVKTAWQLDKNFKAKLMLPLDVVVAGKDMDKDSIRVATPYDIKKNESVLDLGPKTILAYAQALKAAKTIAWNGPLGHFEVKPFHTATMALARIVGGLGKRKAFAVVGGGETVDAVRSCHQFEHIDHVSTGGGAMLEFLAGKKLPGIEALK